MFWGERKNHASAGDRTPIIRPVASRYTRIVNLQLTTYILILACLTVTLTTPPPSPPPPTQAIQRPKFTCVILDAAELRTRGLYKMV